MKNISYLSPRVREAVWVSSTYSLYISAQYLKQIPFYYSLAWCELYLILGTVFRKLDLVPDNASYVLQFSILKWFLKSGVFFYRIENISFREYFVPIHRGRHFHAYVQGKAD